MCRQYLFVVQEGSSSPALWTIPCSTILLPSWNTLSHTHTHTPFLSHEYLHLQHCLLMRRRPETAMKKKSIEAQRVAVEMIRKEREGTREGEKEQMAPSAASHCEGSIGLLECSAEVHLQPLIGTADGGHPVSEDASCSLQLRQLSLAVRPIEMASLIAIYISSAHSYCRCRHRGVIRAQL